MPSSAWTPPRHPQRRVDASQRRGGGHHTVIETSGAGYRRCWTSPWTMPPDLGWSGRWRAPAATGSGLTRFLHATDRWWSRSTTPGGRLLAAGHPVVPVNPSAFHAARPRWSAAGAKSDPGDSYKLADYLRTDGHRLRRLEPPDAVTCELQALVRLRDDHVAAKTAASNQLGALLEAHWPGAKQLFFRLASNTWPSCATTRPPKPPPSSTRTRWPRSATDTPTAVAATPTSSSSASGPRPGPRSGSTQPSSSNSSALRPSCWPPC